MGIFLSNHNDSWWQDIAYALQKVRHLECQVVHDRADLTGNNDDETFQDSKNNYTTNEYYGEEMTRLRELDILKIKISSHEYINFCLRYRKDYSRPRRSNNQRDFGKNFKLLYNSLDYFNENFTLHVYTNFDNHRDLEKKKAKYIIFPNLFLKINTKILG